MLPRKLRRRKCDLEFGGETNTSTGVNKGRGNSSSYTF